MLTIYECDQQVPDFSRTVEFNADPSNNWDNPTAPTRTVLNDTVTTTGNTNISGGIEDHIEIE